MGPSFGETAPLRHHGADERRIRIAAPRPSEPHQTTLAPPRRPPVGTPLAAMLVGGWARPVLRLPPGWAPHPRQCPPGGIDGLALAAATTALPAGPRS